MMKYFLIALLFLSSFSSLAQKKNKPYDYTDTRKKTESFAKLPPELRADLATFTFAGIDESVGKGKLQKIPFTSVGPNFMTFEGNDIKATVITAQFEAWKHKLDYDEKYLIKIDRKPYYGSYGTVPETYINNVTMIIGKDSVIIPPAAYSDLFNLNLTYSDKAKEKSANGIYLSKNPHIIYLYLFSKDATGSYEVTWVIQDKKFVRRVLDYGFM